MKVVIKREALEVLLEAARNAHPREALFLLRGKREKDAIVVEDLVIPPLATHGRGFAEFPLQMLPFDTKLVGSAHSHPSGSLRPSIEDLDACFGVVLILAYPYVLGSTVAYDPKGRRVEIEII